MNLFGTDGIRGIVGKSINVELFFKLGKAISIFARNQKKCIRILIGMDTRKSSFMLSSALKSGLTSFGS